MQPTLYIICGLPGSGKTTKAKEIEIQQLVLRFTPDEWILDIYGPDLNRQERDNARNPVEALQWKVAKRALSLGCNVVLDWGFWSQEERNKYRQEAQSLGAKVKTIFLNETVEKLWSRISKRPESLSGTLQITKSDLEQWAKMFEIPTEEELS
jgi:predicted kinase